MSIVPGSLDPPSVFSNQQRICRRVSDFERWEQLLRSAFADVLIALGHASESLLPYLWPYALKRYPAGRQSHFQMAETIAESERALDSHLRR